MKKILLIVLMITNVAYAARPTIGLVLSGGGARGAAHIGVIEALEEMQVPIDIIVGTSMGAVIGGLYAAGVPIKRIKQDFSQLNWEEIFNYNIKRTDLYYRRKIDTDIFIIKNFISYSNGKIHIPSGIITGQTLYEAFNAYLLPIQPINNFNQLSIPFKAVATDLVSGSATVLDSGDLALSLLASMAVPGIIAPVPLNGLLLVDGGVSANLPIEIAKNMGAEILIVVDVGTPLATREQINDLTTVLEQITTILTHTNVKISKSKLTNKDILLTPVLHDINTSDFSRFSQAIAPGRRAVFEHENELKNLTVSQLAPPLLIQNGPITFDKILLKNQTKLKDNTYFHYLNFDNSTVSTEEITHTMDKLYGLSIFDRIDYGIETNGTEKSLTVYPVKTETDVIYFQGSLILDTDFQGANNFQLLIDATNQEMNSLLGEWRIITRIGQQEGLFAEYYQPLTTDLAWFINPAISISRTSTTLYFDYDPLAIYLNTAANISVAFGRNFSNTSRLKVYGEFEHDDFKRRTGPVFIPEDNFNNREIGLCFEWDTIDNIYFPHRGIKGHIILSDNNSDYGGDADFSQLKVGSIGAASSGKHALVLGALYNRTLENTPNFSAKFFLGGLFELTGLLNQELFGNNAALINAIYYYQWKKLHLIPNRPIPLYLGASVEEGKVWGEPNLSANRFIGSGSVFIGADSILGPIYFAVGLTDTGRKAVHLTLRPVFSK